jgi:hypothetical protein
LYKNVIAVHVDGVRPCLWTVATSGPTVHPPRWCMSMEPRWNDIDRGILKILERDLLQCHFLHHKSHMEWPGPQQWEATIWPPEPWRSLCIKIYRIFLKRHSSCERLTVNIANILSILLNPETPNTVMFAV